MHVKVGLASSKPNLLFNLPFCSLVPFLQIKHLEDLMSLGSQELNQDAELSNLMKRVTVSVQL